MIDHVPALFPDVAFSVPAAAFYSTLSSHPQSSPNLAQTADPHPIHAKIQ